MFYITIIRCFNYALILYQTINYVKNFCILMLNFLQNIIKEVILTEIIINGEQYFIIRDAAKLTNLSEGSLRSYLNQNRFPKLNSFTAKVGSTRVVSQKGINYLNNEVNRVPGKERIVLGGIEFPSKKEAAEHFGFPPEDLSRYFRVKNAIDRETK